MVRKVYTKTLEALLMSILFVCLMIHASAASYSPKASYYLDNYAANTYTSTGGKVIIEFDVNATRNMNTVGASYIVVQVYNGSSWTGVASYFGATTSGMLAYNTYSNAGAITYQGVSGVKYRALVTVYAANDSGSDSRQVTTNIITTS